MVVTEIALSMVLTIGAALIIESFAHIQQVNTGINPENRLAARLDLPYPKYPTPKQRAAFLHDVLDRLRLARGVQAVAVASYLPIGGGVSRWGFSFEGRAASVPDLLVADSTVISPDYFTTIGATLLMGRDFSDHDSLESPATMIVNEAFVRQFLPDKQPLGQRLSIGDGASNPVEIIGVVRDIKHRGLTEPAPTMMYFPITQRAVSRYWLLVHARQDPAPMASAAREAVLAVDKDQPLRHSQAWPWRWRRLEFTGSWPTQWRSAGRRSASAWPWARSAEMC
jgi:putative ABC transport system permease protein